MSLLNRAPGSRDMNSRMRCVTAAALLLGAAACTSSAQSPQSGRKLSIPEAEAGLAKMFSDASGKAAFSCTEGNGRHEFICQGKYVPVARGERIVAHRIGVSVSHYFEGEPVFAIAVLRDGSKPE